MLYVYTYIPCTSSLRKCISNLLQQEADFFPALQSLTSTVSDVNGVAAKAHDGRRGPFKMCV